MTDPVRCDQEGNIALLTIAEPPVNALGHAMKAVVAASRIEIAEGLAEERRLFEELMDTSQRAGLIPCLLSGAQGVAAARDRRHRSARGGPDRYHRRRQGSPRQR